MGDDENVIFIECERKMKEKTKREENSSLVINHGVLIRDRLDLGLEGRGTFGGELVDKLKHLLDIVDLHKIR